MKVLVVCSGNMPDFSFPIHQAFIYDQSEAVSRFFPSVSYTTFFVKGKGLKGYCKNIPLLKKKIKEYQPDIIHAHGGHIGIICGLQRKVPVVVSFHGSDINLLKNRLISFISTFLCHKAIYVSKQLKGKMPLSLIKSFIIPCGVNFDKFYPVDKQKAKKELNFPADENYILFSSHFNNKIKNFPLAQNSLSRLKPVKIEEIKNRSREEVNLLMNGAELLLLTSFSEGSPNVIKEAMACNCPIVAVNVGDIADIIKDTPGCYLTSFDPADVAKKIKLALKFGKRTNGREKIQHLDNKIIAEKIVNVYKEVN